MLKILIIGENPRVSTGQATIGRNIANALVQHKHNVLYLAWLKTDYNNHIKLPYNILFDDSYGQQTLDSVVKTNRPDIVLTIGDPWHFHYINTCKTRGLFQWINHVAVDGNGFGGGIPLHFQYYLQDCDRIIAYTEYGRMSIVKTVPDLTNRIDKIYHGINLKEFFPLPKEDISKLRIQNGLQDKKICLYVGRTHYRKNITEIFKAFRLIKDSSYGKNTILWMHSNFDDSAGYNVYNLIRQYGLKDSVCYHPEMGNADSVIKMLDIKTLNLLYNMSDCLVSIGGEGMGYTVCEAFATKTPVVSIDDSASGELCAGNRARMCNVAYRTTGLELTERPHVDVEQLAGQITGCLYEDNAKMIDTAYDWVKTNLNLEKINMQWGAYFEKFEHPLRYPLIMEEA